MASNQILYRRPLACSVKAQSVGQMESATAISNRTLDSLGGATRFGRRRSGCGDVTCGGEMMCRRSVAARRRVSSNLMQYITSRCVRSVWYWRQRRLSSMYTRVWSSDSSAVHLQLCIDDVSAAAAVVASAAAAVDASRALRAATIRVCYGI